MPTYSLPNVTDVLEMIMIGRNKLADLVDSFGLDVAEAWGLIEALKRNGLIEQSNLWGTGMLQFKVSDTGKRMLQLDFKKSAYVEAGLTLEDFKVLKTVVNSGDPRGIVVERISQDTSLSAERVVSCSRYLAEGGLVVLRGVYRTFILATARGKDVIGRLPNA